MFHEKRFQRPNRSDTTLELFLCGVSHTANAEERETHPCVILSYLRKFTSRFFACNCQTYDFQAHNPNGRLVPKIGSRKKREERKRAWAINTHLLNRGIRYINSKEDLERGFLIALYYVLGSLYITWCLFLSPKRGVRIIHERAAIQRTHRRSLLEYTFDWLIVCYRFKISFLAKVVFYPHVVKTTRPPVFLF